MQEALLRSLNMATQAIKRFILHYNMALATSEHVEILAKQHY